MASKTNNSWEEKLNQLAPPNGDAAWKNMELLLDKHKPVYRNRSHRRIYLSALLLLLLIGVCNCPFVGKHQNGDITESKKTVRKTPDEAKPLNVDQADNIVLRIQQPEAKNQGQPITTIKRTTNIKADKPNFHPQPFNLPNGGMVSAKRNRLLKGKHSSSDLFISEKNRNGTSSEEEDNSEKYDPASKTLQESLSVRVDSASGTSTGTKDSLVQPGKSDSVFIDTATFNQPLNVNTKLKIKTPLLSFGIGLNHFAGINNQKTSAINADGGFGGWKNYTPVLYAKYHTSDNAYLLGEVHINSPQYTPKNLLSRKLTFSSSPGPPPIRHRLDESVYTKKLFYLSIPLSFNVSPAKNVFIGSGIQYSHLSQAIVLYESKISVNGSPYSLVSTDIKSIDKNWKALNLKENEWRFVANAGLQMNRFDIGARYTRSFSSYTIETFTPSIPSKQHNSSLSFFVRYDLLTIKLKMITKS